MHHVIAAERAEYQTEQRGADQYEEDHGGDAGDVPARLRDGRLRDHLRGGADRSAGAAGDARGRSGLARHHDGDEPADLLHASAARADAVLSARGGAARNYHPAYLCRHYSVRADPAFRAGGALVRPRACDHAAACALWAVVREASMKAADLFSLKGRVALVTGASSGLGTQFAKALADNGAAVALVARRADRLAGVKQAIEAAGGRAIAIEADVTDRAAMTRAFDAAEKAFGTVTILVNNAGIAQSSKRAVEVTAEEWRKVLSVDLDAVFYNAQEAARRMLAAKQPGAIVNIASVLGFGVSKGVAAYATAKAAVVQVTKALAVELAFKGVRVNAIAPGWFVTEINDKYLMGEAGEALKRAIPAGRFGKDGDLDGALLLLASDAGSYISGATIVVDGGQVVMISG